MTAAVATVADALIRRLKELGVEVVFGYPGGQLTPLYDALARAGGMRHVLARDEQAACFMADGYARATGRTGVCLAVCGPGVYNAFTPLATADTDSVPVLAISGQTSRRGLGRRSGWYHENDQLEAAAAVTKYRSRIEFAGQLLPRLDSCWSILQRDRPGPGLLEIPLDVLREPFDFPWQDVPSPPVRKAPPPAAVAEGARLLQHAQRPLLLVGGGVVTAGAEAALVRLAERLGSPVFHSFMGKGAYPADRPLHAGLPWERATSDMTDMDRYLSPLFREADLLLAIGCRFTQTTTAGWKLPVPATLVQIDVDHEEIGRHHPVTLGMCGDAFLGIQGILDALPAEKRRPWADLRRRSEPWRLPGLDLVGPLRRVLPPEGIVVADVTRLAYILLAEYASQRSRTFLHPAGSVAMGYGIPAGLGARSAFPKRPIVVVVGDGGFLMSGMELATAVQENLPLTIVLINDSALTLIKAIQERRYQGRFLGVDLKNPDFGAFAEAFGVRHVRVMDDRSFEEALRRGIESESTTLVEVVLGR